MNDNAFGYWLSGFSDGEACFHLKGAKRRTQTGFKFGCTFQIGLRADDLPILEEIRHYFGCGTIRRFHTKSVHPQNLNSKPRFYFTIDTLHENLRAVVPHFDRYPLRSRKARDYVVYREAVMLFDEVSRRPRNIVVRGGARRWSAADEAMAFTLKQRLEDGRAWKEPEATQS